jgi:glycine/serine hydroxymethyltransferase
LAVRQVRRGHHRTSLLRRLSEHRHRSRPSLPSIARELFGAEYAYTQPHSGIDANLVAFWAILANRIELPELATLGVKTVNDLTEAQWEELRHKFGNQRALGMSLDAGGHLTHGFRPNISGKMFHQRSYGTDPETQLLDSMTRYGPWPKSSVR